MRKILLMGTAREESSRVQYKMTRPFGDSTLFEIFLDKFERIASRNTPFSNVIMCINKNDRVLWNMTKGVQNVRIQERNDFSAREATEPKDLFHYLENYSEDYVMWVNACFPLLSLQSIINGANVFQNNDNIKSLHCVKKVSNWFWDPKTFKPITLDKVSDTTTQQSMPMYESVHCYHIHKISDLLEHNKLWSFKKNDPYLHMVPESVEYLDIDTQTEFEIAEAVWRNKHE